MQGNGALKSMASNPRPTPNRTTSRTTEEIRAEIEKARMQIASTAALLRHEVSLRTDWRSWYRKNPALWLGAAVAIGVLLGSRRSR